MGFRVSGIGFSVLGLGLRFTRGGEDRLGCYGFCVQTLSLALFWICEGRRGVRVSGSGSTVVVFKNQI